MEKWREQAGRMRMTWQALRSKRKAVTIRAEVLLQLLEWEPLSVGWEWSGGQAERSLQAAAQQEHKARRVAMRSRMQRCTTRCRLHATERRPLTHCVPLTRCIPLAHRPAPPAVRSTACSRGRKTSPPPPTRLPSPRCWSLMTWRASGWRSGATATWTSS